MRRASIAICAAVCAAALGSSCRAGSPRPTDPPRADAHDSAADPPASDPPTGSPSDAAAPSDASIEDAARAMLEAAEAGVHPDPMANHMDTRDGLLSLFQIKPFTEEEKRRILPGPFLSHVINSDGPGHMNQGNKAIASHLIDRQTCLKGLEGITIQTPEQREKCGAENMVPVWIKGKEPWFCIDVFEFPNKACELPFVWTPPTLAKKVCELQGKRLCADKEWNIACRGDPAGGPDWRYAYGSKVDLEICNTHKGHSRKGCSAHDAKTAWETCATETEPSGSFPRCRSRFGVFDQHGNVAEVMMRREGDKVLTQLKGSAWFYDELVREPDQPIPASTPNKQGAYPDHCNFDPRWHVEPIDNAFHVNYHLGFRCCKSIP